VGLDQQVQGQLELLSAGTFDVLKQIIQKPPAMKVDF
jgi:hypothetical protein